MTGGAHTVQGGQSGTQSPAAPAPVHAIDPEVHRGAHDRTTGAPKYPAEQPYIALEGPPPGPSVTFPPMGFTPIGAPAGSGNTHPPHDAFDAAPSANGGTDTADGGGTGRGSPGTAAPPHASEEGVHAAPTAVHPAATDASPSGQPGQSRLADVPNRLPEPHTAAEFTSDLHQNAEVE